MEDNLAEIEINDLVDIKVLLGRIARFLKEDTIKSRERSIVLTKVQEAEFWLEAAPE